MSRVRIAELKARLSEYLRAVRGGATITVMDRETPVATLAPIGTTPALRVRKPARGTPRPGRVPLPPPVDLGFDVVELLLEERQNTR